MHLLALLGRIVRPERSALAIMQRGVIEALFLRETSRHV
jgi:hypothetical protein